MLFSFVDYGVLLVTCFAYQECWSLETGHLLWLLVLKYRNMQLTSCDSHPPPVWTVWPVPPEGRCVHQSLATLPLPPPRVLLSR